MIRWIDTISTSIIANEHFLPLPLPLPLLLLAINYPINSFLPRFQICVALFSTIILLPAATTTTGTATTTISEVMLYFSSSL